ncbi:hypothetical protein Glove_360g54 [Diversispora epigaea]|uniref:BTB domain-containing protein n=1 Tax=Diversispora epigaea TaxID=1348612 RepID=A0A397HF51_9GLOM|nr:hypothetical protein Glove_360g54 [Diversispora epigaea]
MLLSGSKFVRIRNNLSILQHLRNFHAPKPTRASEAISEPRRHPSRTSESINETRRLHKGPLVVLSPRNYLLSDIVKSPEKKSTPSAAATKELERMKTQDRVVLNIGGQKFETYRTTLTAHPETLLGQLCQSNNYKNVNEIFFDRDYNLFKYILQFYRNGRITWPSGPAEPSIDEINHELDFFKIDPHNGGAQIIDLAVSRVDRFIDLLFEAVFEARLNFKKKLEFTFYREGILPAEISPKLPNIEKLIRQYSHIGYTIISTRNYKIASLLTSHREVAQGGLKLEMTHKADPNPCYKIYVEAYQLLYSKAVQSSALTYQGPKKPREGESLQR